MQKQKLLYLLKKKKGFFKTILSLTEMEIDLPIDEWISILEQKKILLSCVDELDAQLQPFQCIMHTVSEEISEELDAIRDVIQQILNLDNLNQKQRKQELKLDERNLY